MKYELKIATIEDFEFYAKIKSETTNLKWSGHSISASRDKMKEIFRELLSRKNRITYLCKVADEFVGYIYVDQLGEELIELSFAISEQYEGRGFATKFLLKVIEKYKSKTIITHVLENNNASIRVHEKIGFKKTNEYKEMFVDTFQKKIKLYKYEI